MIYSKMTKKLITLVFAFLTCSVSFATEVKLVIPSSPVPWIITTLLLVVCVVQLAIILSLFLQKVNKSGAKFEQTRKLIEASYARKIRMEYSSRKQMLDMEIERVRQRFSMVFLKVKRLMDTLDPEKLFQAIVELIENDLEVERYILFLYDHKKDEVYPFRWAGYSAKIADVLFIPVNKPLLITYALNKKQTIYRSEAIKDAEIRRLADNKPISNTLVAIPLCTGDRLFGLIHIESFKDAHTELDDNEKRFLSSLPTFLGGALANSDVFVQTRQELTSTKKITEKEIQEKKKLREIFSRYTSAELVDNIIQNPQQVVLGGVNKRASILFTDIIGFTSLSNKLAPKEIVTIMNEYLSAMTDVILDNKGEIDKFIGDAVMARFGVLGELESPELSAVKTAIEMFQRLSELNLKWQDRGYQRFDIRVGIATGIVLAGNIGSSKRQEFTVMGPIVNLASRLENFNKVLNSQILICEETFKAIPEGIKYVKHDSVQIRGLDEKICVYELKPFAPTAKIISFKDKLESSKSGISVDKKDSSTVKGDHQ